MPRKPLSYTVLVADGAIDYPAGTTIDAINGMVISNVVPEETVLVVANTAGSAKTVTVDGSTLFPNPGPVAATVPAGGQVVIGPFESARVMQPGGNLTVDFESGMAGSIIAFRVPGTV